MDNDITIERLKNKVKEFCEKRDWDQFHNAKDLAIGISTEASELLEHFRWKNENEVKEIMEDKQKKEEIEHELVDVLYFVLRFAQKNNIDLSDSLERKMNINNNKYPVEKSKGSNKKYTEL